MCKPDNMQDSELLMKGSEEEQRAVLSAYVQSFDFLHAEQVWRLAIACRGDRSAGADSAAERKGKADLRTQSLGKWTRWWRRGDRGERLEEEGTGGGGDNNCAQCV